MTMRIPTNITTTNYSSSLIVKTSSGTLHNITGYSSSLSEQFIQIFDTNTLPADGATPKIIFIISAKSNFSFDLGTNGRYFYNGIVICNSSTSDTKTIGSNDCWFDVQYK